MCSRAPDRTNLCILPLVRRPVRSPSMALWMLAIGVSSMTFDTKILNYQSLLDAMLANALNGSRPPVALTVSPVQVITPDGALLAESVSTAGGEWVRARGIQYAQHPIGALRWQPPVARGNWSGTVDATRFGDDCVNALMQHRLFSIGLSRQSEECLYLNVWAPAAKQPSTKGWPVLVLHAASRVPQLQLCWLLPLLSRLRLRSRARSGVDPRRLIRLGWVVCLRRGRHPRASAGRARCDRQL